MLDPTEQAIVDKGWPVIWIISAAMFGAVVVYTVISYLMAGMPFIPVSSAPVEMIRYIFILLAAGALVLAYFLRKTMLTARSAKSSVQAGAALSFFGQYVTALIISFAISEAIAIFGLILLFLGEGLPIVYAFMAVSALSLFFFRPDRDELEEFVNRTKSGLTAIDY
jgi:protein-S-isoprenylcysteine O-methyltransferase Ste14